MFIYRFLDIFFIVFHTSIIIFNLFGWIYKKTRKINGITLTLTGLSWFVLGIWYGFGYCPCTDWHWQVRLKLGFFDMPQSYVKFLMKYLTGINLNDNLVDILTLSCFFIALTISYYLNIKDFKLRG